MGKKGFTLIELLVVIAILGLLAVGLLATINPFQQFKKADDARRISDIEQIQRALELYYQDNNAYPASSSNFQIDVNNQPVSWGTTWLPYISTLPKDPTSSNTYVYFSPAGNGQTYYLYANLETGALNPQACNNGKACSQFSSGIPGFPSDTACGGICNYGVSSPNVSP